MKTQIQIFVLLISLLGLVSCTPTGTPSELQFEESKINETEISSAKKNTNNQTLYQNKCSSCHGPLATSDVLGSSFQQISDAIHDIPKMNHLSKLTDEEIEFIASLLVIKPTDEEEAPVATTGGATSGGTTTGGTTSGGTTSGGTTTGGTTSGGTVIVLPPQTGASLYAVNCASCHNPLETSDKKGAQLANIVEGIKFITRMRNLTRLTNSELEMIASVLSPNTTPTTGGTTTGGTTTGGSTTGGSTTGGVVVTPPASGATLYLMNCASCHDSLDKSEKKGAHLGDIVEGIKSVAKMKNLSKLTTAELEMIASVLSPNPFPTAPPVDTTGPDWSKLSAKQCEPVGLSTSATLIDKEQYRDIITDVFGYSVNTTSLSDKETAFYLRGVSSGGVSIQDTNQLDQLYGIALDVANYSQVNFNTVVTRFGTCIPTQTTCQNQILLNLFSKLFRRDVTDTDADFKAFTEKFAAVTDFKERFKNIVVSLLMNPRFLFILEYKNGLRNNGSIEVVRTIDNFELASRISFLIWNSVPDEQLYTLARQGKLSSATELRAQVQRMLADPKAERFVKRFTHEWLGTTYLEKTIKDVKNVPGFNKALMEKMKTETELLVLDKFKNRHDFRTYFTTAETFVDATLAANYGMNSIKVTQFTKVKKLPESVQAGLLSQGSFAAVTSDEGTDPIIRGLKQFRTFLCGELGNPPDNASTVDFDDNSKYGQVLGRGSLSSCKSCHNRFDGYGYVMESLNPIGKLRTVDEAGDAVGYSVTLLNGRSIASVKESGAAMADDPKIGSCLSEQLTRYTIRGSLATDTRTDCHFENVAYNAYTKGNSFKDYVEALVLSPLFLTKQEEK